MVLFYENLTQTLVIASVCGGASDVVTRPLVPTARQALPAAQSFAPARPLRAFLCFPRLPPRRVKQISVCRDLLRQLICDEIISP